MCLIAEFNNRVYSSFMQKWMENGENDEIPCMRGTFHRIYKETYSSFLFIYVNKFCVFDVFNKIKKCKESSLFE